MDSEQDTAGDVTGRSLKDPIHELIPLSERLCQFIDTPQFQRLRLIKQLGTSYYVWPGACHNRFEHCIGVSYLARKLAMSLQKKHPRLDIRDRDVECVEIAGLCHDLGHGPWSHVWDSMFIPVALPGTTWTHEEGSEKMLDFLIEDNHVNIEKDDLDFIKALIAGDPSKCRPTEKPFLFDIVSNKRNGLDVDKFDYICRDAHMIGDQGNISLQRLIGSARVIDNQICYNIKDANQVFEICQTRFRLHKSIYNHKTAKAIEYMIIDGLLAAEPHMHIADRVSDPRKMIHLTDDIKARIESTDSPELAPARAIFERIATRDLYRLTEWKTIPWSAYETFKEQVTPERIVEEAKKISLDAAQDQTLFNALAELAPEHVVVDFSPMHYGMKEKNPMHFVKFYSKRNPNVAYYAGHGDYSTLMPATFGEVLMRVYVKRPAFYSLVQTGYRAVLKKYVNPDADFASDVDTVHEDDSLPTSQATNAASPPRTPRKHARNLSMASIGAPPSSAGITINKFATVDLGFTPNKGKPKREPSGSRLDAIKEGGERGISPDQLPKANDTGADTGVGLVDPPEIKAELAAGVEGVSGGSGSTEAAGSTSHPETPKQAPTSLGSPKTPTPRTTRGTKRRSETKAQEQEAGGSGGSTTKRARRTRT